MNKWNLFFIFLSGLMLHEVMAHLWLAIDGLLPFTSRLFFGLTITNELNAVIIGVDTVLLLICVHLGFIHEFGARFHAERHA